MLSMNVPSLIGGIAAVSPRERSTILRIHNISERSAMRNSQKERRRPLHRLSVMLLKRSTDICIGVHDVSAFIDSTATLLGLGLPLFWVQRIQ